MPLMDASQLEQFLADAFPAAPPRYVIEEVADWGVRMRLPLAAVMERPGGTVAGPTLMALADSAAWMAVVSRIGPAALSVTTSLHIDFLRKPPMADVVAEGRLLKLGRSLAVSSVALRTSEGDHLVAQAQVTYHIPHDWNQGQEPSPR